jgi:hypothetical protein
MSNMQWKGRYDIEATYVPGDVIYYTDTGMTYVCTRQSRAELPHWGEYYSGFAELGVYTMPTIPTSSTTAVVGITMIDGGEF